MHPSRPAISALLGAVLTLAVPAALNAADPPLRPIDPPVRYVSLGDSYTSGQGVLPQLAENVPRCRRAAAAFPRLVEQTLELRVGSTTDDVVSLRDASCAGAVAAHSYLAQTTAVGMNPPQFDALTAVGGNGADYVSLGFGANDIQLLSLLRTCRAVSAVAKETCEQSMARNGHDPFAAIAAVAPTIDSLIRRTRQRAPHARILVVGYPAIVSRTPTLGCLATMKLTATDMAYFDRIETALNSMLATRALANGARFVDTYTPSIQLDACALPSQRWIEPPGGDSALAVDHPTARGHTKIAMLVVGAIYRAG